MDVTESPIVGIPPSGGPAHRWPLRADLFAPAEADPEGFGGYEPELADLEPEYEPELADLEAENAPAAGAAVPAGRLVVDRLPLLAGHAGTHPDLVLTWNAMTGPPAVDTVVHLHGYSGRGRAMSLVRDKEPISGLDFADPATPASAGRRSPTLLILPRGNFAGGRSGMAYTFPALLPPGALAALITDALARFGAQTGVHAPAGRLILTAHSGGGAALMAILRHTDPDEVHAFDALYTDPMPLIEWARRRAVRPGGALRVLYRAGEGTARNSERVHRALAGLDRTRYRVERATVGHNAIPRRFGALLLADPTAALSDTAGLSGETIEPETVDPEAESGEVELGEAEVAGLAPEFETASTFPSGVELTPVSGPVGYHEEHWDPNAIGLPLYDTGPAMRSVKLSKDFTVGELVRSGGQFADKARISGTLVRCLQALRDHLGRPITINSGYRSWARNAAVYRARHKKPTDSRHCGGQAADITVGGMTGMDIAKAAIDACGDRIGVGIGRTFAHVDVRGRWAKWTYLPGAENEAALHEIEVYRRTAGPAERYGLW
jgi:hypothetical protein